MITEDVQSDRCEASRGIGRRRIAVIGPIIVAAATTMVLIAIIGESRLTVDQHLSMFERLRTLP
jgi:hypothetical protein